MDELEKFLSNKFNDIFMCGYAEGQGYTPDCGDESQFIADVKDVVDYLKNNNLLKEDLCK